MAVTAFFEGGTEPGVSPARPPVRSGAPALARLGSWPVFPAMSVVGGSARPARGPHLPIGRRLMMAPLDPESGSIQRARPAIRLIVVATTTVPSTYDRRACRSTVRRMTGAFTPVSDTAYAMPTVKPT